MGIKRNPLVDKTPIEKRLDAASKRESGADAFISQAAAQPTEKAATAETVYPWEESGPEIINQQFFQVPLGNNRKLELFWRISKENISK